MPESLAAYQNAIKLDPKFKEAYTNLAQLHREAGNGDEAVRVFKRAINLDATYLHAAHLYGLCLHGMGRTREALAQFQSCLKLDPAHAASVQVREQVMMLTTIFVGHALDKTEVYARRQQPQLSFISTITFLSPLSSSPLLPLFIHAPLTYAQY